MEARVVPATGVYVHALVVTRTILAFHPGGTYAKGALSHVSTANNSDARSLMFLPQAASNNISRHVITCYTVHLLHVSFVFWPIPFCFS